MTESVEMFVTVRFQSREILQDFALRGCIFFFGTKARPERERRRLQLL